MANYIPTHAEFFTRDVTAFYDRNLGHTPLSNFYVKDFTADGQIWKSGEHFYQSYKAELPSDANAIQAAATPNEAKKLGKKCLLRADWEEVKYYAMRETLKHKFAPGTFEAEFLIRTQGILFEGNWWGDKVWGIDTNTGTGQNWLGWLLMAQRSYLQSL